VPVILFHAGFGLFDGGFVGVDVFFVISGYLITTIIVDEMEEGRFCLIRFFERRARRILPALYVVALTAAALASYSLLPNHLVSFGKSLLSIPLFSSNVFFWSERGYFGVATDLKPMVHTCSLAVEEQFYIVYPAVFLLLAQKKRLLYALLFCGFAVSLAASWYLTRLHFETAFYLPISRAWELLTGAFIALLSVKGRLRFGLPESEALTLVGLALILYAVFTFGPGTPFPSLNSAFPVAGAALVIVGSARANLMRRVLSFSPLVQIGLASYSLYLIHQPLFAIARHLHVFESFRELLIVICLPLALLNYRFVEIPFRDKKTFSRRAVLAFSIAGGILTAAGGGVLVQTHGLISRFSEKDRILLSQFETIATYNPRRFDALELKDFKAGKTKVLLVGDSFAKDFLNVLAEGDYLHGISVVTKQISSECGNLYLADYERIREYLLESRLDRCNISGRYDFPRIRELASQADEIWLVSAWDRWMAPFLPETVSRLEKDFGAKVRVFGRKDFGVMDQATALSISPQSRATHVQPVTNSANVAETRMKAALAQFSRYYPLLDDMCGGDRMRCRIFDDEGTLTSTDGGHLTKAGSIEGAKRIRPIMTKILSEICDK
jgi:peptidoglycan/LPS O-acetylase OafA/YrhL